MTEEEIRKILNFEKVKKNCRGSHYQTSIEGIGLMNHAFKESRDKSWGDFIVSLAAYWLIKSGRVKSNESGSKEIEQNLQADIAREMDNRTGARGLLR